MKTGKKYPIKKDMQNIIIISGPAGSGKDTVIERLEKILPVERIITTTTRAPRPGEKEGAPYYFLSVEEFKKKIVAGEFIEYSVNENGGYYGVSKQEFERISKKGSLAIWRVDWKGVVNIKELYPEIPAILIMAPLEVLEARLRSRDRGKDEQYFEERMNYTREWMKHLDIYDYQVENKEGRLDETVEAVKTIIESKLRS